MRVQLWIRTPSSEAPVPLLLSGMNIGGSYLLMPSRRTRYVRYMQRYLGSQVDLGPGSRRNDLPYNIRVVYHKLDQSRKYISTWPGRGDLLYP